MKIQYLAVIFVIIILPISLVVSLYTGNLIKVSNTEAQYNRILFNATHDAVRTYQMNTLDNTYASEDTSKFRDVNASINSFYNNLATGLSRSGYSKEELYEYVPAILFNLYDGYYIYSPYQNIALQNGVDAAAVYNGKETAYSKIQRKREAEKSGDFVDAGQLDYYNESAVLTNEPEFGLRNYNYYACEYKGKTKDNSADYDIVINYTLDNFIRVYGYVGEEFYNYEGYYIYTAGITPPAGSGPYTWTVQRSDGVGPSVLIEPEILGEYVAYYDPYTIFYQKDGITTGGQSQRAIYQKQGHEGIEYFNYIVYNGVKYYLDTKAEHNPTGSIGLRTDPNILDFSGGEHDVNICNDYNNDKFQYIYWYQVTDEDTGAKEVIKEYNTSFNNTYVGIPIFKTEGKQRIYLSEKELGDIIEYMDGYYGGMVFDQNNGGLPRMIENFFAMVNSGNTCWKDLNDVYYYRNAYDFSTKVNEDIFKKIKLNLDPNDTANYSVVSDAYNTKYTAYFEFDEREGKVDDPTTAKDERYYLHEKYDYSKNTINDHTYVFNSWGLSPTEGGTNVSLELVDPDLDTSLFNQHRMDVITSCIEYSFANAVENFNSYMESAYKYKVPDIKEIDWGRICNNISCLTMMQGMPIGNYKFYNNYSLVVDNKVNEYTPKSGICVEDNYQRELGSSNLTIPEKLKKSSGAASDYVYINGKYTRGGALRDVMYHNPGCSDYSHDVDEKGISVIGYRLIDYDIDAYTPPADLKGYLSYTSGTGEYPPPAELESHPEHFVPEGANALGQQVYFYLRPGAGCYDCVVSQNKLDFSIDDLLAFRTSVVLGTGDSHDISNEVRQAYMRALARERGAKARFTHDTSGNKVFGTYQSG